MVRLVFATLVLAAVVSFVGCEKKIVQPTAAPTDPIKTDAAKMVLPTPPADAPR